MIISNFVENSDGTSDFDFKVDAKESEFLMSFAIKALMREGIIKTGDEEFAETEVDLPLETMQ